MTQTSVSTIPCLGDHDDQYQALLKQVQERFALSVQGDQRAALFTTDAESLLTYYLGNIPHEVRQTYSCHACEQFINRFGGLVAINPDGTTEPVFWHEESAPEFFKPVVRTMAKVVRRSRVTGVFLSSDKKWGLPQTGTWRHLAVIPPEEIVFRSRTQTSGQVMAEKAEDYRTLCRALADFSQRNLDRAVGLLDSEVLYRSDKVLGVATWLQKLQRLRGQVKGPARDNLTWLAVATAPAGFCHPRSSMIGTLLEDIAAGRPVETVRARFAAKMRPTQYQRPQAAPTAGNIVQAEKLVAQLGIAESLRRRFARMEDIETLWRPAEPKAPPTGGGVFGHLLPKGTEPGREYIPSSVMTWDKFRRTVLPKAIQIDYLVPSHGSFAALVTAQVPESTPILQWDRESRRNTVSWYVYANGSAASRWYLFPGQWTKVTAVTLQPNMWGPDESACDHQGRGVLFLLEGARDTQHKGSALFPETLKSELHQVRATIEAHSRSIDLAGSEEANANGVLFQANSGNWSGGRFRVTTADGCKAEYQMDRWD